MTYIHVSYKKFIFLVTFLIGIVSSFSLFSQDKKFFKENFLYGEYYLERQQYTDALPFYMKLYEVDSLNANVNYRIGECYLNIQEKKQQAIPYLKQATKNIDTKYVPGKYKRREAPPEAWLLLGEVYQLGNRLDSSLQAYQTYKNTVKGDRKKEQTADKYIESVDYAKQMEQHPLNVQETNLGNHINSRFSDYNPVVSGDQTVLVYTSFWESYDMIFMSRFENGEWTNPRPINKELGAEGDFYTAALSYDGKELILVNEGNYNSDLFVSTYRNGHWTLVQPMSKRINSGSQETSACLSKDGKTLYFSSNSPGGEGGMDIYKATLVKGEWSKVENLGEAINTEFDEEAPSILPDNRTLYFSSNGHKTMGGMDIFYSVLGDDNKWSDPVNVGAPINTTGDDLFFDPVNDGKTAYVSKYSPDGYGRNDIFKVTIREGEPAALASNENSPEDNNQQQTVTETSATTFNDSLTAALPGDQSAKNPEEQVVPYYSADSIRPVNESPAVAGISGNPDAKFTIQVMALKKFVDVSHFSNLRDVKVSSGVDGYYRYTVSEYSNFRQALRQLDAIRSLGYPDAFVREVRTISNY